MKSPRYQAAMEDGYSNVGRINSRQSPRNAQAAQYMGAQNPVLPAGRPPRPDYYNMGVPQSSYQQNYGGQYARNTGVHRY